MQNIYLFTDGSVDTQTKIGYGAYLYCNTIDEPIEYMKNKVQTVCFNETSSSKLELQTLLWAMEQINDQSIKITVFTDSQNIINLPNRRKKLEKEDFISKKNIALKNVALYKQFYELMDTYQVEIIKIKGHKKSIEKDTLDRIFTLVDRASRKALRESKVF